MLHAVWHSISIGLRRRRQLTSHRHNERHRGELHVARCEQYIHIAYVHTTHSYVCMHMCALSFYNNFIATNSNVGFLPTNQLIDYWFLCERNLP